MRTSLNQTNGNKLGRLSANQLEEANHVIDTFFETYSLDIIKEDLRQWYEAAISSSHPAYESGSERSNLFSLYSQLELLTEAIYVLHVKKETFQD